MKVLLKIEVIDERIHYRREFVADATDDWGGLTAVGELRLEAYNDYQAALTASSKQLELPLQPKEL